MRWLYALACLTCLQAAAPAAQGREACIAGYCYRLPAAGLVPGNEISDAGPAASIDFFVMWPGFTPVQPSLQLGYQQGVVGVLLQDIARGTRVEQLARLASERARFLKLWQDSEIDQASLGEGFELAELVPATTARAAAIGLLEMPLRAADRHYHPNVMFADGPPASLSVLMTCSDAPACQLWWMDHGVAIEVTFGQQFLPQWRSVQSAVNAALQTMRAEAQAAPP